MATTGSDILHRPLTDNELENIRSIHTADRLGGMEAAAKSVRGALKSAVPRHEYDAVAVELTEASDAGDSPASSAKSIAQAAVRIIATGEAGAREVPEFVKAVDDLLRSADPPALDAAAVEAAVNSALGGLSGIAAMLWEGFRASRAADSGLPLVWFGALRGDAAIRALSACDAESKRFLKPTFTRLFAAPSEVPLLAGEALLVVLTRGRFRSSLGLDVQRQFMLPPCAMLEVLAAAPPTRNPAVIVVRDVTDGTGSDSPTPGALGTEMEGLNEALATQLRREHAAAKAATKPAAQPQRAELRVVGGVARGVEATLRAVVIPAATKEIAEKGFYEFLELAEVRFEGSVLERIGVNAFYRCAKLRALRLPESVRQIGEGAFWRCSALQSLKLPVALRRIPEGMCYGCDALKEIEFPAALEEIGWDAFNNCGSLVSLRFPKSLRWIGDFAFKGCSGLTSVEVPEGAKIDPYVFDGVGCAVIRV